jgi:hypothetical protein
VAVKVVRHEFGMRHRIQRFRHEVQRTFDDICLMSQ